MTLRPCGGTGRDDTDHTGYGNQIEENRHRHAQAEFSHGLCPDCAWKLYGDYLGTLPQGGGEGC